MVYILWWTLCIHSGEVFSWLLTWTHIHLPPGECSWSGQLLWRVFSSPGKEFFGHPPQLFSVVFRVFWCYSPLRSFFLRMFQTVVLATPNVFAISLWWVCFVFSALMMACFTDSDSSLDLILTVDSNRFRMQIAHLKWTLDLLSAHCNWDSEGITHTWPWNSWEANCPITLGPLTSGRHICKLM